MPNVGDTLKRERVKRKLTQVEMAILLKIKRSTYSLYESGKREPSIDLLQSFANSLGMSIDDLVGWEPSRPLKENLENSPIATKMIADAIRKGFEGKIFQISFNTEEYSPQELLDIIEYADFLKSKRKQIEVPHDLD